MQVACVKTGTKYNDEYVIRLRNGVERFASQSIEFVCFSDRPVEGVACRPLPADLPGWFAKIGLFKLREPLLYFDLDVVITGDIKPLIEWEGFGILDDAWWPGFNSSVMRLTGHEGHVWDNFQPQEMARLRMGDQQWITEQMPDAKTFPVEWVPSYKAHKCYRGAPDGAIAVNFHGRPKPSEFLGGWVKEAWI